MNKQLASKDTLQTRVRNLIAGTQKHFPNGSLTFGGATYAPAALTQLLQGLSDAIDGTNAAKATWTATVQSLNSEKAKVAPVLQAYQSFIASTFGTAPATLADFGLTPRKARTQPTAQALAAAAAKRKATRQARGTLGSVQKKSIKGNVAGLVMTPVLTTKDVAPTPVAAAPPTAAPTASPSAGSTPHTP